MIPIRVVVEVHRLEKVGIEVFPYVGLEAARPGLLREVTDDEGPDVESEGQIVTEGTDEVRSVLGDPNELDFLLEHRRCRGVPGAGD